MMWCFWNVIRHIVIVKINNIYGKGDVIVGHSENSWWQLFFMFWIVWEAAVSAVGETGSCWASSNVLNDWLHQRSISEVQIKQILYTIYKLTEFFEPKRYIQENLANLLLNILSEKPSVELSIYIL